MAQQPSRIAAEKAIEELKKVSSFIKLVPPPKNIPDVLLEVGFTLTRMIGKMADYADQEEAGNQAHDDMVWEVVRTAAEKSAKDIRELADRLNYKL